MISSADREILEIIKKIHEEEAKATISEIRSRVRGFRDSDYIYVRIRKLISKGVIEKKGQQYYILEEPQHSLEEVTYVTDDNWLSAMRDSDLVYVILYAAKYYPEDLVGLANLTKSIVSYQDIKKTFIKLSVLFRLVDNYSILPRVEIPRHMDRKIENDDVVAEIMSVVYEGKNSVG